MKPTITTFGAVEAHKDPVDAAAGKPDGGRGAVRRPSRLCHIAIICTFSAFVLFAHNAMQGDDTAAFVLFRQPVDAVQSSLPASLSSIAVVQNLRPEPPPAVTIVDEVNVPLAPTVTLHDVYRSATPPAPTIVDEENVPLAPAVKVHEVYRSATPPPPAIVDEENVPLAPAVTVHEVDYRSATPAPAPADRCDGRYIYMYDMPTRFNYDLVRDCATLRPWMDMCPFVANEGMGQPLGDGKGVFSGRGWYATDQFLLDPIFHGRMKGYECLTNDSSLAAAVFVPFYGSLDSGRYLFGFNTSMRDALSLDLADWLVQRPEWRAMGGRDHFFVSGRTTWDLQRNANVDKHWGTKLLKHPAVENMTGFLLESSDWSRRTFAIPYPTYFHPETAGDVFAWQEKVRKVERRWLFSFAGGPRPGSNNTVRAEIIQQCGASSLCNLFHCHRTGGAANCNSPGGVMRVFQSSDFCLQPRGDTMTRRSTFDAVVAGCIPVFFHRGSAHTQYRLHFPRDHRRYSVLIPHAGVRAGAVSIEDTLRKFSPEKVRSMREEVIGLIPTVVYADPMSRRVGFKDAFDVAVEAAINRVARRRRGQPDSLEH